MSWLYKCTLVIYFSLNGWLVVLVLTPFETVFQSISGHLPEREKEKRNDRREKKSPQSKQITIYY